MFDFDKKVYEYSAKAIEETKEEFEAIDKITEFNQQKMLKSFINNNVSESMFSGTTGYGYSDRGRETLDKVLAEAMGAEDAIIRHNFTCGTHTLAVALFGVLRPGDTMLCVTGTPYDTIHPVIGLSGEEGMGSLKDFGVIYKQIELKEDGTLDYDAIENAVNNDVSMVYIQRSRGYSLRPSLSVAEIERVVKITKKNSNAIVMVDNCYGEWVEEKEPTQVGADLIAGSLIKNPGGGIARTGGYIAGRHDLIEKCAARLITPGIGREVGCTLGMNRELFLGVYSAPHIVGEALKSMTYAAALFKKLGFDSTPESGEIRHDIIQAIKLHNEKNLIAFCRGIQKCSPVDAFAAPEPWNMPGYDSRVIMAAGAFTLGSSIELSADAPLREPFAVWMQGGLNFHSAKLAIMSAANEVLKVR